MKDQLKPIRAFIRRCADGDTMPSFAATEALTALTQLEAMVGEQEPVGYLHPQAKQRLEKGETVAFRKTPYAGEPTLAVYVGAAPVAQHPAPGSTAEYEQWAEDRRPIAQQPQAEPFGYVSQHTNGTWEFSPTPAGVYPDTAKSITAVYTKQPQAESFQPDWVNYRQGLRDGWAEGYEQGITDERISEANIGIAGFGAKVNPARENPYKNTAPQQAEAVPAWTTEQITAVAQPIAMAIAENCRTAPQLVFPYLFLGLKDLLTSTAPQQAEAVTPDVVRDADRYRWLRDEAYGYFWSEHGCCYPRRGLDATIDAAIAQQKG